MNKIFTAIRQWLSLMFVVDAAADPLDALSIVDFADLPTVHPAAPTR